MLPSPRVLLGSFRKEQRVGKVEPSNDAWLRRRTGTNGSSAYLRRYDNTGALTWTRQFGAGLGSGNEVSSVAVGAGGKVYVSGVMYPLHPTQNFYTDTDAFVAQFQVSM